MPVSKSKGRQPAPNLPGRRTRKRLASSSFAVSLLPFFITHAGLSGLDETLAGNMLYIQAEHPDLVGGAVGELFLSVVSEVMIIALNLRLPAV